MFSQLMTSNGMYMLILMLCIIGGYHVTKLKSIRRRRKKQESTETPVKPEKTEEGDK